MNQIYVQAVSQELVPAALQQVTDTLARRHRVRPGSTADFAIRNLSQIAQTAESSSRIMALLLAVVASISLLVGGIGIMNILLVSVTERTREIGLRMAIGARGLHVLLQFLTEAIFLSVAGGIAGILGGVTVSALVSTSLARGMAAGFWMEAGVQVGRLTMVLVVALALEAVTGLVASAFDIIKYAGAAYLIWLGWGYTTSRHSISTDRPVAARSPLQQAAAGFFVLWSNPKALIFFGAFLPQFVDPRYPAWPQVIVLGLIEMFAALVTDGGYILLAAFARNALTGRSVELVNRVAGVILIGAAVWLALQHQA